MSSDPSDKTSDDLTQNTGTIPQTASPPTATAVVPPDREGQSVGLYLPSMMDPAQAEQTLAAPPGYLPAGASSVDSGPFADGPTGTVMATGPSNVGAFPRGTLPSGGPPGGRYRFLQDHAKGGMGQVSIAVDEELDRQVALKEIQPRYAYDPSVAARFLLEARVTGRLEHPGIVPVYGLNRHADGRPYYAMRFITGESLQDAVQAFHRADTPDRDPRERALALRKLLKRFIDVCNTIAYAHSRGILHRDLKPANVMLGAFGETLVVDWGLAKDTTVPARKPEGTQVVPKLAFERPTSGVTPPVAISSPVHSAAFDATRTAIQDRPGVSLAGTPFGNTGELTEFGKAMGTPAYMAPEQADGRWDDVGMLADIYSLGATLYSILTGKPPFKGDTNEILERVKRGEFVPFEEQKPGVPMALAAVCRKAMAVNPKNRYPTALDLANDVERWMADEPVSVHREPWTVRAARWARRHRNVVLGTAAVLVTAIVTLSYGLFAVNAQKEKTEEAYGRLDEEEKKVRTAYEQLQVEEKRVRDARNTAERSREATRVALLALTDDAIGEILTSQHAATGRQWAFLQAVVDMYRRFVQESPDTPESKFFVAGAHFRVGRLQVKLGEHAAAEQAYRRAFELTKDRPGPEWTQLRGETHLYFGIHQMSLGRLPEAEAQFRTARQIFFDMIQAVEVGTTHAKPEWWHRLGQAEERLGLSLYVQGNHAEAEDWFRNSLANRRTLAGRQPEEPEYQFRIAQSLRQIAMVCNADGRRSEALADATAARDICERLLKNDPTSAVNLVLLAEIDNLLAIASSERKLTAGDNRPAPPAKIARAKQLLPPPPPPAPAPVVPTRSEAARHAENAVQNWSRLASLYPADVGYRQSLAGANLTLAAAEQQAGRFRPAANALAAMGAVLDDLDRRFPNDRTTALYRGRAAHAEAVQKREQDDLAGAENAARRAVSFAERLLAQNKANPRYANDLAYYQIELATVLFLREQLVPAETLLGAAWHNVQSAAVAPGVSATDENTWTTIRGYARLYADLLSDLGRYDQVAVVARRITAVGTRPDRGRFEAACLFGRAAALATRDPTLDEGKRKQVALDLADNGLAALEELESGFAWLEQIKSDPDLLAVRGLQDYEAAIREFREPAPPIREKTP
jgi:serine/threonine protein kinase